MLAKRIIPCLDVEDGRVVKGIKFKDLQDAGDPVELAAMYNEQGADELTFLDIGASYRSREIMIDVVKNVSGEVFIPLTVGGGIREVDDMRRILKAGADKIAICTAALMNPGIISEGAKILGSQCIVLSIDAKKDGDRWYAYKNGGRIKSDYDAIQWAIDVERLGAGEILLNSIDMDGTKQGYDIELTRTVSESVSIPVIASGGAGTLAQMAEAIENGKADAVLLASLLHFGEYTIRDIKNYLSNKGVPIR
ncbi:imidazole glycerol phosphate synthase subunit HisF [candidate division KSB1 bacterium]|nr:imidazole glycerol phosphate synthase subunit HisF [candidate division KSB1 bacterium]